MLRMRSKKNYLKQLKKSTETTKCKKCDSKVFVDQYIYHLKTKHFPYNTRECPWCDEHYDVKLIDYQHRLDCKKKYLPQRIKGDKERRILLKRYYERVRNSNKLIICGKCDKKFKAREFISHFTTAHNKERRIKCAWCCDNGPDKYFTKYNTPEHLFECFMKRTFLPIFIFKDEDEEEKARNDEEKLKEKKEEIDSIKRVGNFSNYNWDQTTLENFRKKILLKNIPPKKRIINLLYIKNE